MLVPWRVLITDSLRDHESLLGQGQVGQVSPFSRVLDEVFCCRFLSTGGGGGVSNTMATLKCQSVK